MKLDNESGAWQGRKCSPYGERELKYIATADTLIKIMCYSCGERELKPCQNLLHRHRRCALHAGEYELKRDSITTFATVKSAHYAENMN